MSSLIRCRPLDRRGPHDEMTQLMDQFFGHDASSWQERTAGRGFDPAVDVRENDDAVLLTAELPGINADKVSVTYHDDVLTIEGEKLKITDGDGERWHRVERSYGSFKRSFHLPFAVQVDTITADYKDGVLHVRAPKAESSKRRDVKISVN